MCNLEISAVDLERLKSLISEFGTYYNNNGDDKPWTFEDVDAQREIAIDIIEIIEPIINNRT
jgi:hypothetical protein